MLDALKDTVFRGLISYSSFVFGFLPNLFFLYFFKSAKIIYFNNFIVLSVLISNSIVSLKNFLCKVLVIQIFYIIPHIFVFAYIFSFNFLHQYVLNYF